MAQRNKLPAKRRPVVKETSVPGGKILTREDGAERFTATSSGALPPVTYTKVKRSGDKIQGKII